ncbi:hypothetical protein [Paenibacillus eucommiae]|uniref:Uncharacterized protein n=1 Tax=Paenibacillus eucommiae TaxID=1355755 RepID=A0ABS4IW19_9BACL|nr:hypothetical protein [Paenibacillus eucommiae]MBP1991708.1 hypothetical protein [Paenibacillus eucommiae]
MTGLVNWVREHNPQAVIVIIALNGGNPCLYRRIIRRTFSGCITSIVRWRRHVGFIIGMYDYFRHIDRWGIYCLTALKENMINHPYSATAIDGTLWDQRVAAVFIRWMSDKLKCR